MKTSQPDSKPGFVAVNHIHVSEHYQGRFEELFASRAHAIDRLPGFISMNVLRPDQPEEPYLIVSHWESEANFQAWTKSPEFIEGHRRGFADLREYAQRGEPAPMTSTFRTYRVISN